MIKRLFDIIFSLFGLIILSPLLFLISVFVLSDLEGGVVFRQKRTGRNNIQFYLLKFRTMKKGSEKKGLLTVGSRDSRITRTGYFLRKYKLDELLQLLNVLAGDMSLVGPRPEVKKYTDMYNDRQRKVLNVKPGITDYASIAYSNENEILGKSANPEDTYIQEIMPAKLELNLKYIDEISLLTDIRIIIRTLLKIIR
jgi:lipopolysaccharide/colanic/teichoic acid biosynthesis glycosyltransferase